MLTASIIIATYNRAPLLDECLDHLGRQRFEAGDEVIVVDNGSTDHTSAVLARQAAAFPVPLRTVVERRAGKSHALAAGLAIASGDILAFTDDDVNVTTGWLASLRETFLDQSVGIAGGPVLPRWEAQAPRWLRNAAGSSRLNSPIALLDFGPSRCGIGERTLLGANMAVRREVMKQLGGFAPTLGKIRGTPFSCEDDDLCRRAQSAGFTAMYTPKAPVQHWVPLARMRLVYFLSWFYWSGMSHARLAGSGGGRGRRVCGVPAYLVRRGVAGLLRSPAALVRGRVTDAVEHALDVAFTLGYATGCWRRTV